jgi:AraC-like DNA-binding protein
MTRRDRWVNVVLHPNDEIGSRRVEPAPDLADLVAWHWMSWWDRRERPAHVVEILTDTSFHLVLDPGRSDVVGVVTGKFTRRLEGVGRIFGVRFKAGAFRPLTRLPAHAFTDARVPLERALDVDARAVERELLAPDADDARVPLVEAFLRARRPPPDPSLALTQALVARIEADPELISVEVLARELDLSVRTLQRLCNDYLGVGPKWVMRRARLMEAAQELRDARAINLADLAARLGYFDQSHFARDFKAVVGCAPTTYNRERQR